MVGVSGVLVLFGPAAFAGTLDPSQVAGALGITAGCSCYCYGSVLTRPIMRTQEPVLLAGITGLTGGIILLLAALALEPGALESMRFHWGWPSFLAWLYLLVPGALLSTTMYFVLVRDWGPSKPGTYAFIAPVIAVAVGWAFFDEELGWADATGMALMLGGAALALRRGTVALPLAKMPKAAYRA
jgi:drug/metabolite transporter (DMT)-like permease